MWHTLRIVLCNLKRENKSSDERSQNMKRFLAQKHQLIMQWYLNTVFNISNIHLFDNENDLEDCKIYNNGTTKKYTCIWKQWIDAYIINAEGEMNILVDCKIHNNGTTKKYTCIWKQWIDTYIINAEEEMYINEINDIHNAVAIKQFSINHKG